MKSVLTAAAALTLLASPALAQEAPKWSLAIHGGAGVERADLSAEDEAAARAALEQALRAGHAQLEAGKSALDASTAGSPAPAAICRQTG